jgi:hypothetical protein
MAKLQLTNEERALLQELAVKDRTISGKKPRHGLDRLIKAGYVSEQALNLSDTIYIITDAGRSALGVSPAIAKFKQMPDKSCNLVKQLLLETNESDRQELIAHLRKRTEHERVWQGDEWIYTDYNEDELLLRHGDYVCRPSSPAGTFRSNE